MRAIGIFEGGGAKGYAHLGALKAAEARNIKFVAVAGTSAGAIISAFVAAGFTGKELFHVEGEVREGVFSIDPFQLLNADHWAELQHLKSDLKGFAAAVTKRKVLRTMRTIGPAWLLYSKWKRSGIVERLWENYGTTSTELLRKFIDDEIGKKLGMAVGERPLFKHLKIPLRVVASNVVTRRLRVFGDAADAEMAVSDAVVASACYPIFFQPVPIVKEHHVDGGMLSNHPAWVFDDLREIDASRTATLGFRFLDSPNLVLEGGVQPSFFTYLKKLFETSLFGASSLEIREIHNYHLLEITPEVETLDFEGLKERAPIIIDRGFRDVSQFLKANIGTRDPEDMAELLSVVATEAKAALGVQGRVHAFVVLPSKRHLRIFYYSAFGPDIESTATIRQNIPGISSAFSRREPIYIDIEKMPISRREMNGLLFSATGSAYAVPIFKDPKSWGNSPELRGDPYGALVFESSEPFKRLLLATQVEDRLATLAQFVGEFLLKDEYVRPAVLGRCE